MRLGIERIVAIMAQAAGAWIVVIVVVTRGIGDILDRVLLAVSCRLCRIRRVERSCRARNQDGIAETFYWADRKAKAP